MSHDKRQEDTINQNEPELAKMSNNKPQWAAMIQNEPQWTKMCNSELQRTKIIQNSHKDKLCARTSPNET